MSKYMVYVNDTEISVSFDRELTEEYITGWREYFYNHYTMKDFAEHIAWMSTQDWFYGFIEGYGQLNYVSGDKVLEMIDENGGVVTLATIKTVFEADDEIYSEEIHG